MSRMQFFISCRGNDRTSAGAPPPVRQAPGSGDRMTLISSLVRADRMDDVKGALGCINVFGITVTQVLDHAPQDHGTAVWKGHEYRLDSSLKLEIRLVVHDDEVDQVIGAIM